MFTVYRYLQFTYLGHACVCVWILEVRVSLRKVGVLYQPHSFLAPPLSVPAPEVHVCVCTRMNTWTTNTWRCIYNPPLEIGQIFADFKWKLAINYATTLLHQRRYRRYYFPSLSVIFMLNKIPSLPTPPPPSTTAAFLSNTRWMMKNLTTILYVTEHYEESLWYISIISYRNKMYARRTRGVRVVFPEQECDPVTVLV